MKHRGRSRLFAARRRIWPKHCACRRNHSVFGIVATHVARTVAPR